MKSLEKQLGRVSESVDKLTQPRELHQSHGIRAALLT